MKFPITIFCVAFAAVFGAAPALAQVGTPTEREAILERAESLIDPEVPPMSALMDDVVQHPFHVRANVAEEAPAPRVMLARIAENLSLDGVIQMGGVRFLLFQGRRVAPGEYLPVEYEGRTYQVQVVDITASSFTLRLNDEEIERNL